MKNLPKHKKLWRSIRKKAPKVPDITCPDIDKVLDIIDKAQGKEKPLTPAKHKQVERILERLRNANDALRESGKYWHDGAKRIINDLIKNNKL